MMLCPGTLVRRAIASLYCVDSYCACLSVSGMQLDEFVVCVLGSSWPIGPAFWVGFLDSSVFKTWACVHARLQIDARIFLPELRIFQVGLHFEWGC